MYLVNTFKQAQAVPKKRMDGLKAGRDKDMEGRHAVTAHNPSLREILGSDGTTFDNLRRGRR